MATHKKPVLRQGTFYEVIMEKSDMSGGALILTKAWNWMQACLYRLRQ
jgi:hypothetical protein